MITLDKLNQFGANTKEGLDRCMNNEAFYLRLVDKAINDDSFIKLKDELENKNYDEAFKIAHSLKGVLGNLSLTPLYDLAVEITENLRISKEIDYFELINKLLNKREELLNK
ncbi:MAG: Hpt domain-containing protein [Acholeplasmatales bacterium]|nr:Hpt domain-containing protein [Acholeplasmatales bacterium]